jgi:Txe/YoeB family toxin of Txe-Axe toxin-antitoxin module
LFTGERFKTELLKEQNGVASKRLTKEDRVTYRIPKNKENNKKVVVLRCKEHYKGI